MNKIKRILLIVTCLAIAGCVEEKSEFTINPDGSGKVVYEAAVQPMDFGMMGEKPDPQAMLKQTVQQILTQSSGVDAWKDVTSKLTDDGKMYFKGTAYFPDISKLKIHNSMSGFPMKKMRKAK